MYCPEQLYVAGDSHAQLWIAQLWSCAFPLKNCFAKKRATKVMRKPERSTPETAKRRPQGDLEQAASRSHAQREF